MEMEMEMVKIAGDCKDDDCAAVFTTDRGTIAVQGDKIARDTPAGEAVVEIPVKLLLEAARALGH